MSGLLKACPACGEPSEQTYCPAHRTRPTDTRTSHRPDTTRAAWRRLSRRARRLQPWCLLCGTTERLEADHSPRAWARATAHLPIRLADINVLCGPCNTHAGSSQPGSARYHMWCQTDGDLHATTPDPTLTRGDGVNRPGRTPLCKAESENETPGGYV